MDRLPASDAYTLAWVAFGLVVVVALIGVSMLAIWLRQRAREPAPASATVAAERRFPAAVVGGHGVLAATTFVLVLLVAAGVGGSSPATRTTPQAITSKPSALRTR